MTDFGHVSSTFVSAVLGALVEFIEELTVVLAVGAVRGWRGALAGAGLALTVLVALVATLGPAVTHIPKNAIQLGLGTLLLLFGMRWLRKAILRAAGILALRNEDAAFMRRRAAMEAIASAATMWDPSLCGRCVFLTALCRIRASGMPLRVRP
jgi:uncharacterized membrane protein